jgi:hypothetical protein
VQTVFLRVISFTIDNSVGYWWFYNCHALQQFGLIILEDFTTLHKDDELKSYHDWIRVYKIIAYSYSFQKIYAKMHWNPLSIVGKT